MVLDPEKVLEKAPLLQRLDYTLKIVGVRDWVFLLFFIVLFILVLAWSVVGTLPITVSGKSIAFVPESSVRVRSSVGGIVRQVHVHEGDQVKQGDLLAVINENDPVTSPADGTVSWVDIIYGNQVGPEDVLMWIQKPIEAENMTILGFFPLYEGQQIQKGMKVNIAPDQVDTSQFGMIQGVVKTVFEYPISADTFFMQKIPSQSLRDYLVKGSTPTIGIVVEPLLDKTNPSGWKWTSEKGPQEPIRTGTIGKMEVILEEKKPIFYLLPILEGKKR